MGESTAPIENIKLNSNIVEPRKQDLDKSYVVPQAKGRVPLGIPAMVKVDEEKWDEIEGDLTRIIRQVDEDKQGIIDKIGRYEEAVQGIPEAGRIGPWDKSCKVRDTLTGSHCRTIETTINQTLGIDPPFVTTVKGDKEKEKRLTGLINWSAKKEFGYESLLTHITKNAVRASLAIVVPEWERRVRVSKDVEIYKSVEAYRVAYPSAMAAGMNQSAYIAQLGVVKHDVNEKGYHECLYEYDEQVVNRPAVRVVKATDFLMHPFTSPTIELAQVVGRKMSMVYNDLKMMERDGRLVNVDKVLLLQNSDTVENDEGKRAKLENKGVPADQNNLSIRDKILKIYKGLYRLDLYGDGIERDYEFIIVYEEETHLGALLRFAPDPIHYGERNYIAINILPEDDTIFGTCIPELLENPQATLDTLIRQLVDSNSIANVPIFKAAAADKSQIGDTRKKGAVYPGRFFFLKSPQQMEALRADRINASDYLEIMRYIAMQVEVLTGASRTLAGQNLADDPEAPGVKTAMLIQRSSFMINEYIKNMRPGLAKLATFIVKLYRQYMSTDESLEIPIYDEEDQRKLVTITRDDIKFLDELTMFDIKNQRVEDNDQMRQQLALQDLQILMAIPQIAENPLAVRALVLNYLMTNPRYSTEEIEKILPTQEQIRQMFADIAKDVLAAERSQQQIEQNQGAQGEVAAEGERQIDEQVKSIAPQGAI